MRKNMMVILALVLLMIVALPVSAATSASVTLEVGNETPSEGETVTVTVSATADHCGSGDIQISYDKTVFELVSGEWLLRGTLMNAFDAGKADGIFVFKNSEEISGEVFKFVLKVKADAEVGKETVTVKLKTDSIVTSKSAAITVSCNHKYDNKCDTTCNLCNYARKITHSYDWHCDATNHWEQCTLCGEQLGKGAHIMATETSADPTGHGVACTVCKLIPVAASHTFDSSCDSDCADCGYTRAVAHVYSERYTFDRDGHWYECILCGAFQEKLRHAPGAAATETVDQICKACGFILKTAGTHVHTINGDWLSDENGHWFLCRCLVMTEIQPHAWDEGVIDKEKGVVLYRCTVCGDFAAEQYIAPDSEPTAPEEAVPSTVPNTERAEMSVNGIPLWILIACGLGISLVVNIILLISVGTWRKRARQRKFTDY